ncbi:HNH endonuclease [Limnoglobus roseus]|uniref:Endonuclease n=1 Tax=Limnoglobus roseus TaxID=2598579 RepID=A0A5C1AMZ3_9BACT|nr:HNH endonuclease [Limnoglobus roseus]QEL19356.1 endonuclease [Limnoglobus roseus]
MQIELQSGFKATVDEEDWETLGLAKYTWQAKKHNSGRYYVVANYRPPGARQQIGVKMHRLILNASPGSEVDHIDGNGLNNSRHNLRLATQAMNQQNTSARGGSSQYKGVSWSAAKGKWVVAFRCNGKAHFVGYFADEIVAAKAYNAAILPLAGEFARLNPV